jgi:DnaJ-class molecular chaperone
MNMVGERTLNWLETADWQEIEECLKETDGSLTELLWHYKQVVNNKDIPETQRPVHLWVAFEDMLEAAHEYAEEVAARNNECSMCHGSGGSAEHKCFACNGKGERG